MNVTDVGTVELHVNDANIVEVLRMLSLQTQRNIIASKDVRGTLTANLYDVTVPEALDAILHGNGYAYREKGSFIYVYTAKEMADIEKSERVMRTEIFRLSYSPAANVVTMIKPVLSPDVAGVLFADAGCHRDWTEHRRRRQCAFDGRHGCGDGLSGETGPGQEIDRRDRQAPAASAGGSDDPFGDAE